MPSLEAITQSTAHVLSGSLARPVSCKTSVPLLPSLSPIFCLQHSQICFPVNKSGEVSVTTLPGCQHQSLLWLPRPAPLVRRAQVPSRWLHLQSGPFGQKPYRSRTLGRAWRAHYRAASPSAALWGLSSRRCAAPSSHLNPEEVPKSGVTRQPLPLCRIRTRS